MCIIFVSPPSALSSMMLFSALGSPFDFLSSAEYFALPAAVIASCEVNQTHQLNTAACAQMN
eukprot:3804-Heterococcus_DN1.PRE.1